MVGKPAWSIGGITVLDGRLKAAKRYTIIVNADDLIDDVLPDWTGFIDTANITEVYYAVKHEVDLFFKTVLADQVTEIRLDVIRDTKDDLDSLTVGGQRNVSAFIENLTDLSPVINPDYLKNAVKAMISVEKAQKGELLLSQLSRMSANQIDTLADLLTTWDVNDIVAVISEIDKRILVVEAIQRLCDNPSTDELHTLHPLILNARWLFGSQFDSPMFVSNSALTTVVKSLFSDKDYDLSMIENPRRRPDIVCLKNYSVNAVCTDRIDNDANGIMKPDQVLIIEVKRGGFEINGNEVSQTEYYVRQIKKSGVLHRDSTIDAYVVGAKLGDIDVNKITDSGRIHAITYGQLVETASGKLFRLRKQLKTHYDSLGQESIVEKALNEGVQLTVKE